MTIGEKIARLRMADGISQEQLADRLGVSRQSVSKWETDQSTPQIDKILLISGSFGVSADELLRDDRELPDRTSGVSAQPEPVHERKFFGTDGFRGEANSGITAEQAFKVGRFLGWYYGSPLSGCKKYGYRPRVILGKDTRLSSYMFEYALSAGLACSGANVYMLHVTTTASVSYMARQENFDCGIMISASHNPYQDNGIKLVNRYGEKIDTRTLSLIESYLSGDTAAFGIDGDIPLAKREDIGAIVDHSSGRNRYIGYLISIAAHSYKSMRVGLDCANGSSWMIAPAVFDALGASTLVINSHPDGTNINRDAGSTHIEGLRRLVRDNHLDVGFAFDGDADRCIAVDEKGCVVDGDKILYVLANRFREKDNLKHNTVVATVMSNGGLDKTLREAGINCVRSAVGDQHVYEVMAENEFMLGGEQSGHIIMQKYATTGDGILTAIMLMEEILDRKQPLSKLAAPMTPFPQVLKNVPVGDKAAAARDEEVLAKVAELNASFGESGRVMLRESGTEQLIRVLAECEDEKRCTEAVDAVVSLLNEKGYAAKPEAN